MFSGEEAIDEAVPDVRVVAHMCYVVHEIVKRA